jgi:hypothetical protein
MGASGSSVRDVPAHRRSVARRRNIGLGRFVGNHQRLGAFTQVVEAHAEHPGIVGQPAQHLDAAARDVVAAERDRAA